MMRIILWIFDGEKLKKSILLFNMLNNSTIDKPRNLLDPGFAHSRNLVTIKILISRTCSESDFHQNSFPQNIFLQLMSHTQYKCYLSKVFYRGNTLAL